MKGIIFKAFEDFVVANFGDEFYEQVLDDTPSAAPGVFVGPGTYPDAVLLALVQTAVQRAGISLEQALTAFGRFAFARLAATAPACVSGHAHPISLLQSIDSIIHIEVKKLYPEAVTPRIQVVQLADDRAQLCYHSERRLCAVLVGLLQGACDSLGYGVQHEHPKCLCRGDAVCEFDLTFHAFKETRDARDRAATQAR